MRNQMNSNNSRCAVRVNVLSPGRFHVLDLSRELAANGFDVKFYSFVPKKRAKGFGLQRKNCCSLLLQLAPFILFERKLFPKREWSHRLRVKVQDLLTSIVMRDSDVVIAMTGNFSYTLTKAKNRGSKIIVHRGSVHILEQKEIMESISKQDENPVPDFNVKRELDDYELADYVAIGSKHVEESFVRQGYPKNKLFRDTYGVDLRMFKPLIGITKEYDVIMVGGWSKRKGCDMLIEALKETDYNFLHVGGIVDVEFPTLSNFTHIDSVDQKELINYYAKAKIFVLCSREDGFGVVLGQAMACGLPIVCSKNTGGEDIREYLDEQEKKFITVIDENTPQNIKSGIDLALDLYNELPTNHDYMGNKKSDLSWQAYGKRYANFLNNTVLGKDQK